MADRIINVYGQGAYGYALDAESVTSSFGLGTALRQRIQVSVRDITAGTPTEIGDAVNNAVRVNVVAGSTSSPNVTITNWTFGGTITTTGASTPNVTVTQWTAPQTVSISGTLPATLTSLTATPTLFLAVTHTNPQLAAGSAQIGTVTSTQGTTPWTVTATQLLVSATQGTNPWTVTLTGVSPVTVTGGTLQGVTVTGWSFSGSVTTTGAANPNVTVTNWTAPQVVSITGTITNVVAVTQSGNTWLVSATQGTNPWVVSASQGTNPWTVTVSGLTPVTFSAEITGGPVATVASNATVATPTGVSLQVVRSLAELLVPISQVVSTTAASATIIPGIAGKRIFVTGYHLVVGAATTVTWIDSAATPNGLTGSLPFAANSGAAPQGTIDSPLFAVVTPGNGLKISQSGTAQLGGVVSAYQF